MRHYSPPKSTTRRTGIFKKSLFFHKRHPATRTDIKGTFLTLRVPSNRQGKQDDEEGRRSE
jgi:hypothetical protein